MSRQSEIAEIKQAVEAEVDDLAARKNISDKVDEIARRQDELAERLRFSGDAFADEMRKVDLEERKLKMWRGLLEREPAAVLVGSVLLFLMTGALLAAMFSHTAVPEIVSIAFLLILGFFFGQTAKGRKSGN